MILIFRYLKYVDKLRVFSGGGDSNDFVYTLIDDSSNGNIIKHVVSIFKIELIQVYF